MQHAGYVSINMVEEVHIPRSGMVEKSGDDDLLLGQARRLRSASSPC